MKDSTLTFNGLSDEQIILVASQLVAATCASLPPLDDEQKALERIQRLFERHCQDLLAKRMNEIAQMSAGMDLRLIFPAARGFSVTRQKCRTEYPFDSKVRHFGVAHSRTHGR